MVRTGLFQIQESFKITSRGLVAFGQITEGKAKVGSYLTFRANENMVSFKIGGVEMMDNISTRESWVGLTFVYQNEQELKLFESIKLEEQLAEITETSSV